MGNVQGGRVVDRGQEPGERVLVDGPVALVPAGAVTVTSTGPTVAAVGAVAVIEVSLIEVAGVAPKLTAVAPVNPVPVMV